MANGFRTIEPKILYFGTPVALISSQNEDGSTNLAPISSFWALGWTAMLGLLVAAGREACTAHRKESGTRDQDASVPGSVRWRARL